MNLFICLRKKKQFSEKVELRIIDVLILLKFKNNH